jgi:hypothetical protein
VEVTESEKHTSLVQCKIITLGHKYSSLLSLKINLKQH